MRSVASGWVVLTFWLWGSWARAQPAPPTFSLEYSVPAGCPARAEFVTSIITRSRGATLQVEAPRVALSVLLTGDRELAFGALVIRLADGQESRREIPAASCSRVLSSMALIAAMILDGGGLDDPPPRAAPGQPEGLAEPAPPADRTRTAPTRGVGLERIGEPAGGRRVSTTQLAAIAGLGLQTGVAPRPVPRFFVGLGLVFGGELSPSLDLVASAAESPREVNEYGDAQFRLLALTLTGCPLRLPLAARFAWRPCLPLEAGVLRGEGSHTVLERTQNMPWVGLGLGLRAEASLSRAWLLELEGRTTLLMRADRFIFEPDSVVHPVPRFVFGLRLSAIWRVP